MVRATEKLTNEDLKGENIYFYGLIFVLTCRVTGSDMRKMTCSVTRRSPFNQIFTSLIHCDIVTGFPGNVTHVDFSPGGVNGIGPLTASNLGGRSEMELFDVYNVQHEEW